MKTKILLFVTSVMIITACTKTEVVPSTPTPTPNNEPLTTLSGELLPQTPVNVEVPPKDVHGADVAGKAQDVPEGTKDGEHNTNPVQASNTGEVAPIPSSN